MSGIETHIFDALKHFLSAVGYPGIFTLMTIEGFGIPIPSELTMPFSGFLASAAGGAKFLLPAAIVAGALGEIVGGILAYLLGFYGGRPMLDRYGRLVLLSPEELERGEVWFKRYGDWVVLVVRLLPVIRSFIALPAGVVRMPIGRFVLYSAIGSFAWCTGLAVAGHALGQHWGSISRDLSKYNDIAVVLVIVLLALGIYKRVAGGRKRQERERQAVS
ncbi:MAG: DedA family protein [Chloroflexota bacterium]|nr:DedA family protein [Chloroflexota bacterium]